jgi:hypothetical protein
MNMATVKLDISEDEAWALAQMCKRICYSEMEAVSTNAAGVKALERALWTLRQALAGAGFDTRE